jgi:hypothetical protein
MNKKIATEIAVGIILIVTVIISGFIWLGNKQNLTQTSTPVINNKNACREEKKQCSDGTFVSRTSPDCEFEACPITSDWKTHINNKYGYQIKYPVDAVVENNQAVDLLIFFPNYDGNFRFSVDEKANVNSLSDVKKYVDKRESEGEGYPYKQENVKINSKDAYMLSRYDLGVIEKYYLPDNGKLLEFDFEFNFKQPNSVSTESRKKLISDILLTFKPVKLSINPINAETEFDACGKKEKYQRMSWWDNFRNKTEQINFYSDNYIESALQKIRKNEYRNPAGINYTYDTYCEDHKDYDICAGKNDKLLINNNVGNDLEGCLSKDGNLFIVVFPGVYMGGGSYIFRYDTKNNVLEEARRINEKWGDKWVAVPREFLKREENIIKMRGAEGDAGYGIESFFDYNFIDNQVKLIKSCPIGEGSNKNQCTNY